jgi:hypothetical protein
MPILSARRKGNRAGWCYVKNDCLSLVQELAYLAAGDAACLAFEAYSIEGPAPSPIMLGEGTDAIDVSPAAVADMVVGSVEGGMADDGGCDYELIEAALAAAVEAGTVKARPYIVHRFWQRARHIAGRILARYAMEHRAVAETLAVRKALCPRDVRETLAAIGSPLATMTHPTKKEDCPLGRRTAGPGVSAVRPGEHVREVAA